MPRELFRKESLERLSSPEQLDSLMQVTTVRGWIVLLGAGVVLLAALCWSFFGIIPIKTSGGGIIMHPRGAFAIIARSEGVVRKLGVKQGDAVAEGQVVAHIERSKLAREIAKRENVLRAMREEYKKLAALHLDIEDLTRLLPEGDEAKLEKEFEILLETGRGIRQLDELKIRIIESGGELDMLKREHEETTRIVSPYDGVVLELDADEGQFVSKGSVLLRLEMIDEDEGLKVLMHFSPADGKKIGVGMRAQVVPEIVNHEEYGYIQAVVEYVSKFPLSRQALMRIFQNEDIVDMAMKDGAPIGVVAGLVSDSTTVSGFRWSTPKGPPFEIHSGTVCHGLIIIEEKRPVDFVLPLIRGSAAGK